MSAFDDLTLGEVDDICRECLEGKAFTDDTVDPLKLAGAVMWATVRKSEAGLTWDDFRYRTSMGEIKAFSATMMAEDDPASPLGASSANGHISGISGESPLANTTP